MAAVSWFVHRPRKGHAELLVVLLFVLTASLLGGRGASAHVILVESEPSAGSSVDQLRDVRLTFVGEVAEDGHAVVLMTVDGGEIPATAVDRPGPTMLTARFDEAVPPGDHQIRWEVVARDGDRQRGSIPITVGAAEAATADPDEAVAPPPPTDPEPPTSREEAAPTPAPGREPGDKAVGWVPVAVVLALLVLLAAATLAYRRSVRPASR